MFPTTDTALAIDIGSSSVRVSAYTADGQPVPGLTAHQPYAARTTPDGGAEFDAGTLRDHVFAALDAALALPAAGALHFSAVGVDTFATSLLGVDATGAPLTPLFMWNDTRSRAYIPQLGLDRVRSHDRTGAPLHVSYWPSRLRWLADTQPDTFGRVAYWLSIGDWLALTLFGAARVSTSLAAWTGLLDRRTGGWDAETLAAAGIDAAHLATISDAPLGTLPEPFAARWPSLRAAVWFPALADGYTANIGGGAADAWHAALTMGTSGALRVLLDGVPERVPDGLFCYRVNARQSLIGGALSNVGNVFAWLRDTLAVQRDPFDVSTEPGTHGLTVLPFWAGERSPGWHDSARASILGLTLHTTADDIARAALEGVIYQLAAIDDQLTALLTAPPKVVAAGGVLAQSPGWAQVVADVLGRDVAVCADAQASARGAALLALGQASAPTVQSVYRARPAFTARHAAARQRQREAYDIQALGFKDS